MDSHRGFRSLTGSGSQADSPSDAEATRLGSSVDTSRVPETPGSSSSQPTRKKRPKTADLEKNLPRDSDGRLLFLRGSDGVLMEPPSITKISTKIFKRTLNPTGFTWKLTPPEIRKAFWEEFKKEFSWEENMEAEVFAMWEKKTRKGFSDTLSDAKQIWLQKRDNMLIPDGFSVPFWNGIREHWTKEEVKAMAATKRAKPDGPGTGISKHSGGSRSARVAIQTMAEETGLSRAELSYDLFLYCHKKQDGSYTTKRDANLDARIHQITAEEGRTDFNNIYLEVCHPHKSRRYGSGSEGESQLSRSSRTSSSVNCLSQEMVQTQLSTLEERVKKAEEDSAADRAARESLEQRMAMFEQILRASGQLPPPPQ